MEHGDSEHQRLKHQRLKDSARIKVGLFNSEE
jgi:hypothetical protein